ncbi:hypothetical protein HOD38_01355 [archaeon]|jgi:hypothetical protein|nr:hypothetical protein [archaeon]MBT4396891.1 hypothetical protein [archaeon]MBT4441431.1 hypothetical protein [archaeon]
MKNTKLNLIKIGCLSAVITGVAGGLGLIGNSLVEEWVERKSNPIDPSRIVGNYNPQVVVHPITGDEYRIVDDELYGCYGDVIKSVQYNCILHGGRQGHTITCLYDGASQVEVNFYNSQVSRVFPQLTLSGYIDDTELESYVDTFERDLALLVEADLATY